MRPDVEVRGFQLIQNPRPAKPGRAQLESQPAVDAVAHGPAALEQRTRPPCGVAKRVTPRGRISVWTEYEDVNPITKGDPDENPPHTLEELDVLIPGTVLQP